MTGATDSTVHPRDGPRRILITDHRRAHGGAPMNRKLR